VAEPLRIKGSDGKTYLNPKADRDFLATFIDRMGQLISGDTYGPDYNYMGKPVTRFSTESEAGIPVVEPPMPENQSTEQETSKTPVGEYQYPRVEAQTDREKETDRMVDVILNLPETKAEAAAKVDYEGLARENFRKNNPALESMPEEEEFLFNRYKRNLASKLAKQDVTPEQARENPEQAFLAGQLEKYLAEESKPQSNIGRRRGF
jgi:hypothetical protein